MPSRATGPPRDLGPCCVVWDPDTANIEMTPVFGSVVFRSEDQVEDIFWEEHGRAPVDAVFAGRVATLEVPMTSPSLTRLEVAIHDSVKQSVSGKWTILKVPNPVGDNMLPVAKEIIIKPEIDQGCSATTSEWLHIFRCYPVDAIEIAYDNATQRIYNVTFKCFPDDASGTVGLIWRFGPYKAAA